jgi:hypothetical protein
MIVSFWSMAGYLFILQVLNALAATAIIALLLWYESRKRPIGEHYGGA